MQTMFCILAIGVLGKIIFSDGTLIWSMNRTESAASSFYPSAFGCKGYCHEHDGRAGR